MNLPVHGDAKLILNGFCIVTVKVLNSYVVSKIVRRNKFPIKIVTAK